MKKLLSLGAVLLIIAFGLIAYWQNENAKIYRADKNKMHQELIKVRYEAQAARLEVAKLKQVIEAERKHTEQLMQKVMKKK